MSSVFISYVHENEEEVKRLSGDLEACGVRVWRDRRDIAPGTRWRQAIRREIRQENSLFIACFSEQYNDRSKTFMNEELTLAIEELRQRPTDKAWFIPVKLNECEIPDREIGGGETLQDIQYIELYKDWDAEVLRIFEIILVHDLQASNSDTRVKAVTALAKIGSAKAISNLIDAMVNAQDKQDWTLLEGSYNALRRVSNPAATQVLVEALHRGSSHVRQAVAVALGRIATPIVVPELVYALSDEDGDVQYWAADALRHIGTPEALEAVDKYERGRRRRTTF